MPSEPRRPRAPVLPTQLYAHRRTHTPLERRFFCPVPRCSKSFLRRYSLRTHLVGHGLTPDAARAEAAAAEPKRAQDAADLPDVANAATAAADPDSSRGPSATAAAAAPAAARAYHRHGINCGHVIVRHGDHVDVVDRGILWVRRPLLRPLSLALVSHVFCSYSDDPPPPPFPGAGPRYRRRHAPARAQARVGGSQAPQARAVPCARSHTPRRRTAGQAAPACAATAPAGGGGEDGGAHALHPTRPQPPPASSPHPRAPGTHLPCRDRRFPCPSGRRCRGSGGGCCYGGRVLLLLARRRVGGPALPAGTLRSCVRPKQAALWGHGY